MTTNWIIATTATGLQVVALWLYGNNDKRAPVCGLIAIGLWAIYNCLNGQWLLMPQLAVGVIVALRNLCCMRTSQST